MPWYFPWSEAIKKRACRYLLQRYLGQFLQEKLSLDQLTVDLYSGKGVVTDVLLDVELINETFEAANLSFEIIDGFIACVSVEIPWSALLSDSTHVEIQGLEVTLKPKQVSQKSAMLDSMWGSMTKSSMQLAEELLKEEERNKRTQSDESERRFEGLEKFAQAIDIVLTRIKVDFSDITIRLEQVQDESKSRAVALEVRIKKVSYFDEAAEDARVGTEQITYNPLPIANKCFRVEGIQIFSDEYASTTRTTMDRLNSSASCSSVISSKTDASDLFYSATDLSVNSQLRVEKPTDESIQSSPAPRIPSGNLVQIAVCHGTTEIRLKVKQNTDICGPKFELDGHMGILHILLWPKQLEMLRDLFGQIWKGRTQSLQNKSNDEMHKQMTPSDYSKIETELQRDLDSRGKLSSGGGNSIQRSTWDFHDVTLEDDEFYPVGIRQQCVEEGLSGKETIEGQQFPFRSFPSELATVNTAKLKVKSFFLTLIEANPTVTAYASAFAFNELQRFSISHFETLSEIDTWDLQDTLQLRDRFARSLPQGHIWFNASGVIFEAIEKQSPNNSLISVKSSASGMEIWEHLFDAHQPEYSSKPDSIYRLRTVPLCTELLTFPSRTIEDRYSFAPCVLIQFEMFEKLSQNLLRRSQQPLARKIVKVTLQPMKTDIDVTIIDRLNLLREIFATSPKGSREEPGNLWSETSSESSDSSAKFDCSLICSNVTAQIRFPVLDLRPVADRAPWSTRALQKESLIIEMAGFTLSTKFDSGTSKKLDFECHSLTVALQMSPDDEKSLPFLRAVMDVDNSFEEGRREEFADRPKMSIFFRTFPPKIVTTDILLGPTSDEVEHGGSLDALLDSTEKDPSLFSTQKNMVEHEEINCIIPSALIETTKFKENVVSNCKLVIEISIPSLTAFIVDKQMLEVLYNRINTDLLLWEPSEPKSEWSNMGPISAAHLIGNEYHRTSDDLNTFEMCRSTAADEDSASEASDNEYYSREVPSKVRSARLKAMGLLSYRSKVPNDVCVICNIGKAGVGAKVENFVPGKAQVTYESWIELENLNIFSVSGYRGQPEMKYSTISINRFSFSFGDYVEPSIPRTAQVLDTLKRPCHLIHVALPLEDDMQTSESTFLDGKADEIPMLNMAIEISVDTFRNVKDIKVAMEFNAVKIYHSVTLPENFWLIQMIDFVNLKDFPVLGYNCPTIITEFHLNLTSSLLEYRPKHLPIRSAVSVEKMNISSTIVADSPQSLMRVITQDLRVHLSKKKQPTVLKNDYACVVDIPFVEFQMKLTDGSNPKFPRFDFRASNNCCYLRTCSDSCHALSELIVYLANDGDLNTDFIPPKAEMDLPAADPTVKSQEEQMNDEMMDAMKESPPRKESVPKNALSNAHLPIRPRAHMPMVASITSSLIRQDNVSDEDDIDYDGFCVIEEEFGVGIPPKSGQPCIKFLSPDPIRIVEDHFTLPSTVTDQLKAPEGYPVPVVRLTLREMSLIWCLYGGRDFDEKGHTPRKLGSYNRLQSAPAKLGEARSSSVKPEKSEHGTRSPSWLRQGGPGRDHAVLMEIHLNKVKFQHEMYPFDGKSTHAARQVLFIQDFEIRDRMANSEINKFLYQYVSTTLPKQSHKHMFSVKALHERPDPSLPMQECTLKMSLQPLRLNIDQESLFFLSDFFTEASDSETQKISSGKSKSSPEKVAASSSSDQLPMRTRRLESVDEEGPVVQSPLIQFDDIPKDNSEDPLSIPQPDSCVSGIDKDSPIFFKSVVFSPEVPIRLDYYGKYVDMERVGALGGLLVGLAQLNCSMLRLSRIHNRQGIRGFDRLILLMLNEWLTDIKKTQLANLLGGVGPMHCLVQLVQGVRDLFWLPVEQYRKDGRIVRGVQRGASAFTTSTLIATIELTNRIVQTVQVAAESAYDVISPGPSFRRKKKRKSVSTFPRSQPGDIREGIVTAYQVLSEGISDTAREIVDAVSEEHEHKGMTGAVGATLRQVGPVLVKPLILASQATSNVLGGLRNQLQPDFRQDEIEKWRTEDDVKTGGTPR